MRRTTSRSPGLGSVLVKGGLIIAAAWLATRYFGERASVTGARWDWPRSGSDEGWSWPRTSSRAGRWDWPTASGAEHADRTAQADPQRSA